MAKRARANYLFATSIVVLLLINGGVIAETQQQHVHDMSHGVMPFDVAKTVHIFKMTETGGVERVVVKARAPPTKSSSFNNISAKKLAAFSRVTIRIRPCCTGQICRGSRNFNLARRESKFPTPSLLTVRRLHLKQPIHIC